jgi:hypothetical protein
MGKTDDGLSQTQQHPQAHENDPNVVGPSCPVHQLPLSLATHSLPKSRKQEEESHRLEHCPQSQGKHAEGTP